MITGGAGFLGSHLCERFLREGWSVVCMDNLLTGDRANVRPLEEDPHFTFVRHDVTETIHLDGPLDAILQYAQNAECDVIAMGTHGRGGVMRLALGSTADAVMRAADRPVLLVSAG